MVLTRLAVTGVRLRRYSLLLVLLHHRWSVRVGAVRRLGRVNEIGDAALVVAAAARRRAAVVRAEAVALVVIVGMRAVRVTLAEHRA